MMTQTTESLQFVNDWSELERAVEILYGEFFCADGTPGTYVDLINDELVPELDVWKAVETIKTYVPRLLTQYANLVELSFALTEGWETYATLNAPTGLYLPDNR